MAHPLDDERTIYVPFARELFEERCGRWSPDPVFVKFDVRDDGIGEIWFQRPMAREPV